MAFANGCWRDAARGKRTCSFEAVVTDILILAECSREGEWEGQVVYLPL